MPRFDSDMDYHAYFHGEEPETDRDMGDEDDGPARDADVIQSLDRESARELAWWYRMGELP